MITKIDASERAREPAPDVRRENKKIHDDASIVKFLVPPTEVVLPAPDSDGVRERPRERGAKRERLRAREKMKGGRAGLEVGLKRQESRAPRAPPT